MRNIKFGEVRLGETAKRNIQKCVDKNWLTMGPMVAEFEKKCAEKMGYQYVVAVNSGTMADTLAYLSLNRDGSKRGKKVIVPALSFIATATAAVSAGLVPVPVDIKRETLNIDETKIEEKIDEDVIGVCVVSTMGRPPAMYDIREICHRHNLPLVVDNCEGHFCKYQGRMMGEFADLCTYSGYVAHVISSASEFGWIGTNNKETADYIKSIRSHGRANNSLYFNHENYGLNGKPTDMAASVALEALELADDTMLKRRYNLLFLLNQLRSEGLDKVFYLNEENINEWHCPHALSLTFREWGPTRFKKFYEYMENKGIEVKLNFKSSFTQHTALSFLGYKPGDFPESEWVGAHGLHLGVHQYLDESDLVRIILVIKEFFKN